MSAVLEVWVERANALSGAWAEAMERGLWQGAVAVLVAWAVCGWLAGRRGKTGAVQCWVWRAADGKFLLCVLWMGPVVLKVLPAEVRAQMVEAKVVAAVPREEAVVVSQMVAPEIAVQNSMAVAAPGEPVVDREVLQPSML